MNELTNGMLKDILEYYEKNYKYLNDSQFLNKLIKLYTYMIVKVNKKNKKFSIKEINLFEGDDFL